MRMRRNVIFKLSEHIGLSCLLITVLKVSGTFAQANYCSGGLTPVDNCLKVIETMMKNTSEMPTSIEELNVVCADFTKGMKCIRDFAFACLQETKRDAFLLHFEPAMYVMDQLCENHDLRKEYLKYPECIKEMGHEWDRCSKPFVSLIHGEKFNAKDHSEEKIFKICCTKLCFLDCINQVSSSKCVPEASKIHRDIATNLSGSTGNQDNCSSLVNPVVCKDICSRSHRYSSSLAQVIGCFLVYILLSSWQK